MLSLEPGANPTFYSGRPSEALQAFVRLCAHYFGNAAWLPEGILIREAGRLAGIPGVLIHGRLDLSCPTDTAWELANAWPGAELTIVDDAGHHANDSKRARRHAAMNAFADR